ncbi:hypothetical protein ACH5RR_034525 [Cinchona calisaya]|uniref:FAF domain-containing protein n=1 Tax=Cinchona calisaya TaxID=153742 RepID=A0ABD2YF36_9GENT
MTLDLGDCIGLESCVDLKTNIDEEVCNLQSSRGSRHGGGGGGGSDKRLERTEKEYPPPIPWLARTENLASHMPWILKRYYTNDGRLIIKEEKAKPHEYFQAHRSNGRLTLRLVPLNDDDDGDRDEDVEDVEFDERISEMDGLDGNKEEDQTAVVEESRVDVSESGGGSGGGGGRGQFYKYSNISMSRNSCIIGMGVATFRPVHT